MSASLLLIVASGCGGASGSAGPLQWQGKPRVFTPQGLPRDRVMSGRLKNESLRRVDLTVGELTLRDDEGKEVPGSAVFLYGFVHGLYPPTRQPKRVPDAELLRTGRIARILPGKSTPITVSWRGPANGGQPVRLDYKRGSLELPTH